MLSALPRSGPTGGWMLVRGSQGVGSVGRGPAVRPGAGACPHRGSAGSCRWLQGPGPVGLAVGVGRQDCPVDQGQGRGGT